MRPSLTALDIKINQVISRELPSVLYSLLINCQDGPQRDIMAPSFLEVVLIIYGH
jgi:hypothetical protein